MSESTQEQRLRQFEAVELPEDDGNPFAWREPPTTMLHRCKETHDG